MCLKYFRFHSLLNKPEFNLFCSNRKFLITFGTSFCDACPSMGLATFADDIARTFARLVTVAGIQIEIICIYINNISGNQSSCRFLVVEDILFTFCRTHFTGNKRPIISQSITLSPSVSGFAICLHFIHFSASVSLSLSVSVRSGLVLYSKLLAVIQSISICISFQRFVM